MVSNYQAKMHQPERDEYPVTREFMSRSFVTVYPDDNIYVTAKLLLDRKITGAPVVNRDGQLLGMISEKDCLRLVARDIYENMPHGGPVRNYMTADVVTVDPDLGLTQVAEMFIKLPYKKIPVVEGGRLVGLVRRGEVLAALQNFHRSRLQYLRKV